MEKQNLIDKLSQVKDPTKDYLIVYEVLDALGVKYKKSNCHKCRRDLYNIAREELGLIQDASFESDFNSNEATYIYTYKTPVRWKGRLISKNSSQMFLRPFCEEHPDFCMHGNKIDDNQSNN